VGKAKLLRGLTLLLMTYVVSNGGTFFQTYLSQILSQRMAMRLRKEGFANVLQQGLEFYDTQRDGDLLARLGPDVEVVRRTAVKLLGTGGLRPLLELIGTVGILIYMSPRLSVALLSVLPITVFSVQTFSKKVAEASRKTQEAKAEAAATADEVSIITSFFYLQNPHRCRVVCLFFMIIA
jgi:ABC-type multidrug transport system fused ATPase/permease subunit